MDLKISQLPSHSDLSNISAMVGVYNGQNVQISGADMLAGISGVSEVTASLPLSVAKGTTTPAISLSQVTNTTDGYLSSVDWNTFNNKTSNTGTVTGVISNTTNQLTVTNGSTNAELDIQTAVVAKGGTALATGDQIASYVSSEIAANVPSNIALVSTSTANYVPRWNATTNTLENGTIQNVGSNVGIGTIPVVELHVKGASSILRLETTSNNNDNFVEFYDPTERKGWIGYPASTASTDALFIRNEEHGAKMIISTTNAKGTSNTAIEIDGDQNVKFKGAYTFPTADGSTNQVLQTDGAGQLTFATLDLSNITGTLGVANGGTGYTSYTIGSLLYASDTQELNEIIIGSAGTFLRSNATTPEWSTTSFPNSATQGDLMYASSVNNYDNLAVGTSSQVLTGGTTPSWGSVDLSTMITGTLGVANGGTGQTTVQTAIDALTQVSGATTGDVLTKDASGNASWATPATGGGNSISQGDSNITVTDTGADGTITFTTDGTAAWEINNNGHLLPKTNNTFDIGSATQKVRDIYVSSGSIKFVGTDNTPKELGLSSSGGLEFEGSPVGGEVDLTTTPTKQDLTQSSQTQYGEAVVVEASANINNGAVVIWDYSGGQVRAKMPSGSTPDQHEIIGIALDTITAGSTGRVCIYGFATAKYDPSIQSVNVTSLALNSGNTGNTSIVSNSANPCVFTDSGGIAGNYTPNVNYTHTFYNDGGNISLKLVDWDFEQSSSSIWDRIGFTVSNDGTTFTNAEFSPQTGTTTGGWRRSVTSTAPWSSSESTSGTTGYILCADPDVAFPQNTVVDTGYPYVRAYFTSDGSGNEGGWQIEVYGTNLIGSNVPVPGQQCFISINDLTEVDNDTNTSRPIGTFFGTDITNDAVVVFVAPNRPQST